MKAGKENSLEKKLQQKRHPVRQKLLSVLLCVCLLAVSLPTEFYGGEVRAEGVKRKILSFSDLPAEVKHQTVEVGTSERKLNLPDTLTAVCVSMGNESTMDIEDIGNIENLSQPEISSQIRGTDGEEEVLHEEYQESSGENGEEASQENHLEEVEEYPTDGSRIDAEGQLESPTDSGSGREEFSEILPEDGNAERNWEETVVIENVTWTSAPAYDSGTEGVYAFLPVLPGEYVLAEGVELPEIQVEVRNEEVTEEGKERRKLDSEEEGEKEADGGAEEIEYFASSARESQVISADTTWDKIMLLSGGELVINEGVTLTINERLYIRGNVTIRGGGTIVKGSERAFIDFEKDPSLTVLDVTVDGKSIESSSMFNVSGGELILDGGCRIENCTRREESWERGGAVYISNNGSTATFNDCVIENCSANEGGAVYISDGATATFNGCVIENCSAGTSGGAVTLVAGATATFRDCVIENCSANFWGGAVDLAKAWGVAGTATFSGCVIENCSAGTSGGAVLLADESTSTFNDCVIENCSAGYGGGVQIGASTSTFNDCVIENCSAGYGGGAVYCLASILTIKGASCIIQI